MLGFFLGCQLACVAAGAIRADTRVNKLRPERFDLFLGSATNVVRLDYSAEPPGRKSGAKVGSVAHYIIEPGNHTGLHSDNAAHQDEAGEK